MINAEMKATVLDAVKMYIDQLNVPLPEGEDLFDRSRQFLETIIRRGGLDAALLFVDELHKAEKAAFMKNEDINIDAYFAHMELVRMFARTGDIARARKEAQRYAEDEMKEDALPVVDALVEIAVIRNAEPEHLEFALRHAQEAPPGSMKVDILLNIANRFRRRDALAFAIRTADGLEQTGPGFVAACALRSIAEFMDGITYWQRAIHALSTDPDKTSRDIGYKSFINALVRRYGQKRMREIAATCPYREFQVALNHYIMQVSPSLN